jgi:predicted O-methyltransferase YrrM
VTTLGAMPAPPAYRKDFGWRAHSVFGALNLRPAVAQHSEAEAALLKRVATGARTIVEIGVAEGGSAWDMRSTMDADGTLVLIDPYPRVMGLNLTSVTARRLVGGVERGRVEWLTAFSRDAVRGWERPIDVLLIDGDHSYDATRQDIEGWSPHVREDGAILFHDALLDADWMSMEFGSAQFVAELRDSDSAWRLAEGADSLAVFRRA